MRQTFVKTILEEAKKDTRIILLTGDLGYSVFEMFMNELPKQYLNTGIAEQNMTGMAAGLAMEGYKPIIYSIIPFSTMRNFEQIRNDICYQNLDVKIIGVGAGFSYGPYGHTHHGLEDIGVLRTLPNMTIVAPGDPTEVNLAVKAMMRSSNPTYMRLGKTGEKKLYSKDPHFTLGKGIILRDGIDGTIIATSTLLSRALEVADILQAENFSFRVISMHTIKPLDRSLILESARKTTIMISLEEHSVIGGLGSAISEILAQSDCSIRYKCIGVPDRFTACIGFQEYMRKANGLTSKQIAKTITRFIHEKNTQKHK